MDSDEPLRYWTDKAVATIQLNRPDRKNAFTLDMIDAWAQRLRDASADDAVGAIVVTGAGDAFCSGADLAILHESVPSPLVRKQLLTERVHAVARALQDTDKPVIAAVNGAAVGAGMDMALMCDIRFAARSARFSEAYIRIGLVPGDGGAYFLPRLVGTAKALELLLTGDFVDAIEAERIGIVNRVYDDEVLLQETYAFAERLAASPPVAVRMTKRAVYQSLSTDLRTSLDLISSHFAIVQSTEDYAEAQAAFTERRPGNFTGH